LLIAAICYVRTTEGLTPWARLGLGGLRLVALLALLVMVSGAVCTVDVASRELPRMLVLVDDSPSMTLGASGTATRAASVQQALNQDGLLDRLKRDFDVRLAATSGRLVGADDSDAGPQQLSAALVREATRSSDLPVSH